jgi:predicted nucleotidyltransferase
MPDKKLEEIINRILKVIIPDKIILFGSRAKGSAGLESDYDILIIKSGPINEAEIEGDIYESLLGLNIGVDILLRTPEEIEESKKRFFSITKTALEEGTVVYG